MSKSLVIHHDDLGASHSANTAFLTLCDAGIVTSGSVMVPCPWFPELAQLARRRPDLDIGVHLTLTAEFEAFRWRPLTGVADNGLTDADGFMPRTVAEARRADPAAVDAELRAQIDTALAAGIDVTHLDAHMGAAWQPEFLDIYVQLGADYSLPIALTADADRIGADPAALPAARAALQARGNPDFRSFVITPFGNLAPTEADYGAIFASVGEGLTYGAFHFTAPGDILAITPDAPTRLGEYDIFHSGAARRMVDANGIVLTGMRPFREMMRSR